MSNTLVLRPGHVTLAQWRQVYRGAPLALDPAALPVVRASAAAVAAIAAVLAVLKGFAAQRLVGDKSPSLVK